MFILTRFTDLIRLDPTSFKKHLNDAIVDEINNCYANKIIDGVGLCICVYDLIAVGEGQVMSGDGAAFTKITFRMVVFRPFVGEVLEGWISSCTAEGIKVKMEFFDDIFIPAHLLFENSQFVAREQAWMWCPDEEQELFLDTNEKIRFRIEQEKFQDLPPLKQGFVGSGNNTSNDEQDPEKPGVPPYSLIASCQGEGMGLVSWWE